MKTVKTRVELNRIVAAAWAWTGGTLPERFRRHRSLAPKRRGSALLRAVFAAGIGFKVVRVWPGDRHRERQLKASATVVAVRSVAAASSIQPLLV